MKYYCIPTNIGMAAASNAFLTGTKVNITTFVVGDGAGSEYEPAPDMTALRGQVWQGAVTNAEIDSVSPNIINYTALLPSNVGGFTMREMGLKDDTGRLIGVGNMASTPKIKFEDGISDETELIFSLTISTPEAMEWKVDPTVIIATKKDIDKHNTNTSAHEDLRAELGNKATEIGQLILANTRAYPHSNAIGTVSLVLTRWSIDYLVSIEVLVASGSIEGVEVYDKQLNGFKIRYSGSAASATIKYYVSGGMKQ